MQVATTSLERAKGLYDTISGEARESELAGRLTDRAAQALLDANLFSMLVARSNSGLEAGRAEFFETVETIAKADGSGAGVFPCARPRLSPFRRPLPPR
jgi:alkylation response protein AidB-like acyl-CoA dehydrogenase